jgi:hypothetical protein
VVLSAVVSAKPFALGDEWHPVARNAADTEAAINVPEVMVNFIWNPLCEH